MEIDGDALAASAAQSCAQAIAGLDGAEPIGHHLSVVSLAIA